MDIQALKNNKLLKDIQRRLELALPFVVIMILVLGWFVTMRYERAVKKSVTAAYQETQLEIVRAISRSTELYVADEKAKGKDITAIEQGIFKRYIEPIHLLENGDAWIYAPDHVVFDLSSDFPDVYRGKSMAEIFAIQKEKGATHYDAMTEDVTHAREGIGWYIWLPDKGPEIAAWTPVRVGEYVWTIGLSTPLSEILEATGAKQQGQFALVVMTLTSLFGLGLTLISTHSMMRRRQAERRLQQANAELEERVRKRTEELKERTRALMESQFREKMKEKEAEIAYNTGLFEAASSYLHNIGNSLAALDGKLLNIRKVLDAGRQYPEVLRTIREAHAETLAKQAQRDRVPEYLDRLETVLVREAMPRLRKNIDDIIEIKEQMIVTIRHQQDMFSQTKQRTSKYVQEIPVGEIMENILSDFRPSFQKRKIKVWTDIDRSFTVRSQKHQMIHGLNNLIKNAIEAIDMSPNRERGEIQVSVCRISGETGRMLIRIRDNGIGIRPEDMHRLFTSGFTTKPDGHGLGLHSFLNFLNENNGSLEAVSQGVGKGAEFIVEIGNE
jgi:signal transduction histidine kinase